MASHLPRPNHEDERLLREVGSKYLELDCDDLTAERLVSISNSDGLDFATALAYDRIRQSTRHQRCIAPIESCLRKMPLPMHVKDVAFCLIPNFGYSHELRSQQTAQEMLRAAAALGCATTVVPTLHSVDLLGNVELIRESLSNCTEGNLILLTMSIGGAGCKLALGGWNRHDVLDRICGWINVCGLLDGVLAASLLNDDSAIKLDQCIRGWFASKDEAYVSQMIAAMRELAHGPDQLLGARLNLPPKAVLLNVVPFPLERHIVYEHTRQLYQMVAAYGPNDGFALIADMISKPGEVFPIWGADHYINLKINVGRLVDAAIRYVWNRAQHKTDS